MSSKERSPSKETYMATWKDVDNWVWNICDFLLNRSEKKFEYIYGIHRGGLIPAVYISNQTGIPMLSRLTDLEYKCGYVEENVLVIDDVIDTGKVLLEKPRLFKPDQFVTLVRKTWSPHNLYSALETKDWIKFPWEK